MTAQKHTPGPWAAKMSKYREGCMIVQAGIPSKRVLAQFGSDDEPLDEIDQANARLIAAAPEMLEAFKRIAASNGMRPGHVEYLSRAEIAAIALDAIDKAEGLS